MVLTAAAADCVPLTVLLLPQVLPVDWPVAGCVYWLIVGTARKLIPSVSRCVGIGRLSQQGMPKSMSDCPGQVEI